MGDNQRRVRPEDMATTSTAVTTVTPQPQEESVEPVAVITLRPTRAQARKKVVWTEDTVDNENMNKKKSKCCCIYEKPRRFGESDSESSDDECEHCFGHVERRKQKQPESTSTDVQDAASPEPSASITLRAGEPPDKLSPPS